MTTAFNNTLCAIATPPGSGAIAVIRVSGKKSASVARSIFFPKNKSRKTEPNAIVYGEVREGKKVIDDVLFSFFKAPHSYTGEDGFEIYCHGSLYIQKEIMRLLLKKGATLAEPGEFTQRAFLNGKMDLSQAEAVADLIASDSEASHRIAMQQMRGGIRKELEELRTKLLHFAALIELELDFSEEDVEFADRKGMVLLLDEIEVKVKSLLDSFERGNAMKSGISVVIAGPVNSGKSTLLNAILKEDRAIVSDIPGTTRDVIEDSITMNGIRIRFSDTAGLRTTKNTIENLGIKRTYSQAKTGSLILFLSTPDEKPIRVRETLGRLIKHLDSDIPIIHIINKSETLSRKAMSELDKAMQTVKSNKRVFISAKFGKGMNELTHAITEILRLSSYQTGDVAISNARHAEALSQALKACRRAQKGFRSKLTTDLIAQEIRQINYHLGTITGQISDREILGRVFEKFCIGK